VVVLGHDFFVLVVPELTLESEAEGERRPALAIVDLRSVTEIVHARLHLVDLAVLVDDLAVSAVVRIEVGFIVFCYREGAVDFAALLAFRVVGAVLAADAHFVRILVGVVELLIHVGHGAQPVGRKKALVLVGIDPVSHAELEGHVGAGPGDGVDCRRVSLRIIGVRLARRSVGVAVGAEAGQRVQFELSHRLVGVTGRRVDHDLLDAGQFLRANAGDGFGCIGGQLGVLLLVADQPEPAQRFRIVARRILRQSQVVLRRDAQLRRIQRCEQRFACPVVLPGPVMSDAGVVVQERRRQARLCGLAIAQQRRPVQFVAIQPVAFFEQFERCERKCRQDGHEAQRAKHEACHARTDTGKSTCRLRRNRCGPGIDCNRSGG